MIVQHCECTKTHWIVYFKPVKMVNLTSIKKHNLYSQELQKNKKPYINHKFYLECFQIKTQVWFFFLHYMHSWNLLFGNHDFSNFARFNNFRLINQSCTGFLLFNLKHFSVYCFCLPFFQVIMKYKALFLPHHIFFPLVLTAFKCCFDQYYLCLLYSPMPASARHMVDRYSVNIHTLLTEWTQSSLWENYFQAWASDS